MPDHDVARRNLLRGVAAATAVSYSRILGANDRVQMALIGCGERGRSDLNNFVKLGVDVVALSDIWDDQLDKAKQIGPKALTFHDYRGVFDLKEVDATLVATPDHWHAPIGMDALHAGKDVYIEKPLTLKPEEGPAIVKAARVNKRVCQVGMQQRSGKHYLEAKREYLDSGKLGKLTLARSWWHGNSYHLRKAPAALETKPENLDWAAYLGRLKWRDWDPQQYWNWRAYLDFGGGQVTDLFTHWIDVVHMFTGQDNPIAASAIGGVYNYQDGRTAPDTINVLLEYPSQFTATFEATLAPGITGAAVEFAGTKGRLLIDRGHYEFHSADRGAPPVTARAEGNLDQQHMQNFLDCVRSRRTPNGDVLIGHRSAQASHLGNISYMQKRRIDFDPAREEILPF